MRARFAGRASPAQNSRINPRSDHRASRCAPQSADDESAHRRLRALAFWIGRELDIELSIRMKKPRRGGRSCRLMIRSSNPSSPTPVSMRQYRRAGLRRPRYVRDNGVEQYVRDARITRFTKAPRHSGARSRRRKMAEDYGRLMRRFFHRWPISCGGKRKHSTRRNAAPL